jgi:TPR repeat protein
MHINRHFGRNFALLVLAALAVSQPGGRLFAADANVETASAAAEKGDAKSQYDMAKAYEKGEGIAQDHGKAAEYARKSAEQGYPPAEVLLGYLYSQGLGVTKDPAEALKWYRKGAEDGNAVGQLAMGNFYSTGLGVPKDTDEAIKWWQKAAEQDNAAAANALAQALFDNALKDRTNRTEYAEAAKWLRVAADRGYPGCMNSLGYLYEQGQGVEKDWKEAARRYREAAEHGNVKAQGNLGILYLDGRGVTNDVVQAYAWFKLSAMQGGAMGRKYLNDYHDRNLLDAKQLAEGDRLFEEYQTRIRTNSAHGAN